MFDANRPVVLRVCPVAELICDVFVQGGRGGVRAGPTEPPASITCIMCGQTDWWPRSHCTTQRTGCVMTRLRCDCERHSKGDSSDWQMSCELTVLREIQRPLWDGWTEGLCRLLEEVDSVFDANGKSTSFISTLVCPVLTCILCCIIVRQTLLPAGTWTQRCGTEDLTYLLHYVLRFDQILYYRIFFDFSLYNQSASCPGPARSAVFTCCCLSWTRAAALCFCVHSTCSGHRTCSHYSTVRTLAMETLEVRGNVVVVTTHACNQWWKDVVRRGSKTTI